MLMEVERTISDRYRAVLMIALGVLTVVLWLACMLFGSVDIPCGRVVAILSGRSSDASEAKMEPIIPFKKVLKDVEKRENRRKIIRKLF